MTVWTFLWAAVWLLVIVAGGRALRRLCERLADMMKARRRPVWEAALLATARSATAAVALLGVARLLRGLPWPARLEPSARVAASIADLAWVGVLLYSLVDVAARWIELANRRTRSRLDNVMAPMIGRTLRIVVVVLVLVQAAQILSDKPITSILAGLGIGGLAIALAAQDTVRNFFGSVVLFADKPFEIGDRIAVDSVDGRVEWVGFRSTRIRTLDGELVTIPNGDLAGRTIRNIGKRSHIRRVLNIGLTYDTPPENVERALALVKDLLENRRELDPNMPPKVFFTEFRDWSLNLQVIYWLRSADWWAALEFGERLNLDILRAFSAEGIRFAFPTQTVHLQPATPDDRSTAHSDT